MVVRDHRELISDGSLLRAVGRGGNVKGKCALGPSLVVLVIKCPTHHFELTIWAHVERKQIEDIKFKRAQTWTQVTNLM
jgi:hypothetical protein